MKKAPKIHRCTPKHKGVVIKAKGIIFCGQCGAELRGGKWVSNKKTDIKINIL